MKKRVWQLLEAAGPGDTASRAVDVFILLLILANAGALCLETVEPVRQRWPGFFRDFELFSVACFSVEYLGRVWSCTSDPRYAGAVLGRARFVSTPMALIDLAAILPFYLPYLGVDLRVLRILRMFRLARVLKLARYSEAAEALGNAVRARRAELITVLGFLGVLVLISSAAVYYAEHEAQPEQFSSIPAAMWWAVVTLTTVGYGDVFPVTPVGRSLGAVIAVFGIGMVALPTSVLGAAFMEELQRRRKAHAACPHCGKEIGPA